MKASHYPGTDRRQTPRTTPEAIHYIDLEPNNGGILLNISEGGLCFCVVAPLRQTEALRVRFSAEGYRVEADAQLAWTDETHKSGGLRFTSLSVEMREQIRK